MKNEGAGAGGDRATSRLAATHFAADDLAVLLSERAAVAEVFAQLLDEATDAARRGPGGGAYAGGVHALLGFLHTRQSDAALEAMQLRRTGLELIDRMRVLQTRARGAADQ